MFSITKFRLKLAMRMYASSTVLIYSLLALFLLSERHIRGINSAPRRLTTSVQSSRNPVVLFTSPFLHHLLRLFFLSLLLTLPSFVSMFFSFYVPQSSLEPRAISLLLPLMIRFKATRR